MKRRPFLRVGTRAYTQAQIRAHTTLTNADGVHFSKLPTGIVCYTEAPELSALLIRNAHAYSTTKAPLGATIAILTRLKHAP